MSKEKSFSAVLRTWVEVFMHRSFRDFRRFMEEADLSPSQVGALMRLHYNGACYISDIGQHIGITVAAASQLVDRLVVQGYLERSEDQTDRRFKQIKLTPKGQELIKSGIEHRQKWMEQLTEQLSLTLSPAEQETISEALALLTKAALALETSSAAPSKTLQDSGSKSTKSNEA
jgi:DNA-binding MarR family transcriptional regulator